MTGRSPFVLHFGRSLTGQTDRSPVEPVHIGKQRPLAAKKVNFLNLNLDVFNAHDLKAETFLMMKKYYLRYDVVFIFVILA